MKKNAEILIPHDFTLPPYLIAFIYAAEAVIAFMIIKGFFSWYSQMKILRLKLKQNEAEIEMLDVSAGLNPHFIQNMFEFAIGNIKNKTTEKSLAIINDISAYLKKVLGSEHKTQVTLLEEMENTRQYMDIQLRINPELFQYGFYVKPTVRLCQIKIPHMILQPIIENCIRHGFAGIPHKGFIAVSITCTNEIVTINIKDNGKGIQNEWSQDKIGSVTRKSKGIEMTRKRLVLAAGTKHSKLVSVALKNNSSNSTGTEFIMQFPVQYSK